jgi:hypothetical protein
MDARGLLPHTSIREGTALSDTIFAAYQLLHPSSAAAALDLVTTEDVLFLGTNNIQTQIRAWRRHARPLATQIKQVSTLMQLLNKGLSAVQHEAARYQSVGFQPGDIASGNSAYVMPTDSRLTLDQADRTTLNNCGWCVHAKPVAAQGTAKLASTCTVLDEGMVKDRFARIPETLRTRMWELLPTAGLNEEERFFFSPCWLWYADQEVIDDLAFGLHLTLVALQDEKEILDEKLQSLTQLKQQAEHKPLLPADRDPQAFAPGMPLMIYLDQPRSRWITGLSDGVQEDQVVCSTPRHPHTGQPFHIDYRNPSVMAPWDYRYLRAKPEFAAHWVRSFDHAEPALAAQLHASLTA